MLKPRDIWQRHSMTRQNTRAVANKMRPQLEAARLDLRALYRALDHMLVAQSLPAPLRQLQELDADFAEALYVLDRPPGRLDWGAMIDDTRGSLARLPALREAFLATFDASTRAAIEQRVQLTRGMLSPEDAYLEIPGRDPTIRRR
ncbi:MAG: hypothetical protein ABIL01_24510 [Pseudomonadota bacterium]